MYCVGLTGSIGSGKTTVANLFAKFGVEIIHTDQIARDLTQKDTPAWGKIVDNFGSSILQNNGELNRALLREQIFQHPQQRVWLEKLLHPLIRQKIKQRLQKPTAVYYMIEIPLLTSKKNYAYLNQILLVVSEPTLQMERTLLRDHSHPKQTAAILDIQANEEVYRAVADDVLMNNGAIEDLQEKVAVLHRSYLQNMASLRK